MPIQIEYDTRHNRLETSVDGLLTFEEIQRHLDDEEAKGYLWLPEIFDCKNASTALSRAQTLVLVERLVNYAKTQYLGPTAIVAKNPLTFGMARMFEIICELHGGPPMGVSNNRKDGERWLKQFSGTGADEEQNHWR
jgi:hypothetical protein